MPAIDPFDLLTTAEKIVAPDGPGRPLTTHIRRAVSTVYYALFHGIAASNANMLVGTRRARKYSKEAWNRVYRALSHRQAANRCESPEIDRFSLEIQDVAYYFCFFQVLREISDYSPDLSLPDPAQQGQRSFRFVVSHLWLFIPLVREAIDLFFELGRNNPKDPTDFAVYLLFDRRRGR